MSQINKTSVAFSAMLFPRTASPVAAKHLLDVLLSQRRICNFELHQDHDSNSVHLMSRK
jgi:hypothetical protein